MITMMKAGRHRTKPQGDQTSSRSKLLSLLFVTELFNVDGDFNTGDSCAAVDAATNCVVMTGAMIKCQGKNSHIKESGALPFEPGCLIALVNNEDNTLMRG